MQFSKVLFTDGSMANRASTFNVVCCPKQNEIFHRRQLEL